MPRFIVDENNRRTVCEHDKESVGIGRNADSDVRIHDRYASNRHCRVERHRGDQYVLVDLGSQNGTRVNGQLVDRVRLREGDAIRVGRACIWFETAPPPDAPPPDAAVSGDTAVPGESSTENGSSEGDRLQRLRRIAKALNSELKLDRLLEIIMDHVVEVSGAERGFLVLVGADESTTVRAARNFVQEDVQSPEAAFSTTIVRRAVEAGEPVLSVDVQNDQEYADTTAMGLRVRSVMAIPLSQRGKIVGAVYVDNRLQKGAFGRQELETLASLGDLAGAAIERARLFEENERAARELAVLNRQLEKRVRTTERELDETRDRLRTAGEPEGAYPQIIGRSRPMRDVLRLLDKLVRTEEPVLISGASGTGKELIARAIHHDGPRGQRPFLSENCAALPDTLLASELFGHVRGAFTGADRDKRGLFELADKGTLFLDEVGDMSPEMQKKLLRVLQEGEIRPVGGKSIRNVDVRIISASNKALEHLVRAGEFREDLYYRLRVLTCRLPSLRERKEDIPELVAHFMKIHARSDGRARDLGEGVMDALRAHDWPGNVRELENEVKRMLSLGEDVITPDVLSPAVRRGTSLQDIDDDESVQNLMELVEQVERREIQKALLRSRGNKTRAAEMLGISRFTLQRKLDKYEMGD